MDSYFIFLKFCWNKGRSSFWNVKQIVPKMNKGVRQMKQVVVQKRHTFAADITKDVFKKIVV
jgi:hypothetical protein